MLKFKNCPKCKGKGYIGVLKCFTCGGKGYIKANFFDKGINLIKKLAS